MQIRTSILLLVIALFVGLSLPSTAQAPVAGSGDPEALFTSPDPKLHANKQVVLHIVRDLLEANHWSDAPKYIAPDPGAKYTTTWFDMWRIRDGKAVEHWDPQVVPSR